MPQDWSGSRPRTWAVRAFRLRRLGEEEAAWEEELRHRERFFPELRCVVLLRVEAGPG